MQICFVDVSTLSVEDKDSKVGTLSSPQSCNGRETAKKGYQWQHEKGRGCDRGWKGGGNSGGKPSFLPWSSSLGGQIEKKSQNKFSQESCLLIP